MPIVFLQLHITHVPVLRQAPEVFIGNYGMEADMWAAGMMMYQLLADRFPWCGRICTQ